MRASRPALARRHPSRGSRGALVSMTIDLSVLEEEYEKMTNTPVVAVRPPASCSQAQKDSSFLSVCPTGLAALDCRPLLNTSVEEIVRSPVALPHGLGSNKSWPIAPDYVENKLVPQLPRLAEAEAGLRLAEAGAAPGRRVSAIHRCQRCQNYHRCQRRRHRWLACSSLKACWRERARTSSRRRTVSWSGGATPA